MNAQRLMRSIIECGADESGIQDRFMDDAELYASCFQDFMQEPNFEALDKAMREKDYAQAFLCAHALKGLAGNLGLSGFYGAIDVLVESLRAKRYQNIRDEYATVLRAYESLKRVWEGQQPLADEPAAQSEAPAADRAPSPKRKPDRFIPIAVAGLGLILLGVGLLFGRIYFSYEENISQQSAAHLVEINYQLKLYIEEKIANDWKIAHSVGDSISEGYTVDGDEAVFARLRRKKAIWKVTDLMLYTENGYCICADGDVQANDTASDTIDKAREQGSYMSVVDSDIIYTVPVETRLRYNGSRIVAVSVIQSMAGFLDDMGFSSFEGNAWMYLTEENGIVVSRLNNDAAVPTFNFMAVTSGQKIVPLRKDVSQGDLLTVRTPAAFMMAGDAGNRYVVSTPIETGAQPMRLFYLAPEEVVDETMTGFSRQLLFLSLFVSLVFAGFSLLFLVFVYRVRKKQFGEALLSRERMFDLLIKNTQTAFGLFTANQAEPEYVSSNAPRVVGDRFFALDRDGDGFHMRNSENTQAGAILKINEMMRGWDGAQPFKSGYILNERAVPPNYFEIQLFPVDQEGRDFVGIAQDVTQAHERETATRNALEMAERSNAAKSRFLSNMSHDIRTPMNAIVNMTDFAIEHIDQPRKLNFYLQTIRESSDHLLHLINDVLDMSRIESGQTVIGSEPFDIMAELKRQADIIRPLAQAKGQIFITDFSGIRTTAVRADQLKFSQVIMNLLSNAVKFTPEKGAVRFTAQEIPSMREDIADMRFVVEDNGIGIPQQFLQRVFEPFSRADDKRVSKIEGTGLGLSICHSYVAAMGGTISCESEESEGSIFTVELFFQKAQTVPAKAAPAGRYGETPFLGMRCLVGEDNETNQTIALTMLERLGFMVDIAGDGREVLNRFLKSNPGAYDVIYLDIQMPFLDGYQVAVAIRESAHPQAATIPIVAMTANVFAEDIEKARIAGMDGHLGKPLMSISLIEETNRAINKRGGDER